MQNETNDVPTHPIDDQYIREWLVLGPFFPNDLETDFLASVGGEANINPKAGDTLATVDGKTLQWQRYITKGHIINFNDVIGNHQNATAYAFCRLHSCDLHDQRRIGGYGCHCHLWYPRWRHLVRDIRRWGRSL